MIYSKFGSPVEIVRVVTDVADVKKYEFRKPDGDDKKNVSIGNYVITRRVDDGEERLASISYLRADGGFSEIAKAMRETGYRFPTD